MTAETKSLALAALCFMRRSFAHKLSALQNTCMDGATVEAKKWQEDAIEQHKQDVRMFDYAISDLEKEPVN